MLIQLPQPVITFLEALEITRERVPLTETSVMRLCGEEQLYRGMQKGEEGDLTLAHVGG